MGCLWVHKKSNQLQNMYSFNCCHFHIFKKIVITKSYKGIFSALVNETYWKSKTLSWYWTHYSSKKVTNARIEYLTFYFQYLKFVWTHQKCKKHEQCNPARVQNDLVFI